MPLSTFAFRVAGLCMAGAMLAACAGTSAALPIASGASSAAGHPAGRERVLYSFTGGGDGGNAATALALDANGNLYGTAVVGGRDTCGVIFELSRQSSRSWNESVLYNFDCYSSGKNPHGGVTFDPKDNLDGTTVNGGTGSCGSSGCGVAFQFSSSGEKVLHGFSGGTDGLGPGSGVVFDTAGNLYGTTPDGGAHYQGVVYQISPSGREKVLHAFTGGKDGGTGSLGLLLVDSSSALYGVTETGGAYGAGTVYKLAHAKRGWRLTTLYAFKGTPDAASPYGGLVADGSGNLYGTTYYGGASGVGTVFELARRAHGYHEHVLYSFRGGSDGSSPTSTLLFGKSGDLYGTTSAGGGSCDCGTIFKVDPKTGTENVLHSFGGGNDGAYSYYGLTQDSSGNLYGTTVAGGSKNQGAIFVFTP